jgi:hypothetical protein
MRLGERTMTMLAAGCLALAAHPARAADPGTEARLREALRSVTSQLRELEGQRARWQATEAAQKRELEALQRRLAEAPRPAPTAAASTCAAVAAELHACEAAQAQGAQAAAAGAEALSRCEAARATEAGQAEAAQAQLRASSAGLAQRAGVCTVKNARLQTLARQLLHELAKQGSRDRVLGLKRVELENLAQDAEDTLLEAQLTP